MKHKNIIILMLIVFSFCKVIDIKEEPLPENPYRRALLENLRKKIECEDCNPTKEELIQYYLLKNESEFQASRNNHLSYSNSWQNYFNTYFLYFPRNLRNPWYTPGSGSSNGGRAPGVYYPPYGMYGQGRHGNFGGGRRY